MKRTEGDEIQQVVTTESTEEVSGNEEVDSLDEEDAEYVNESIEEEAKGADFADVEVKVTGAGDTDEILDVGTNEGFDRSIETYPT